MGRRLLNSLITMCALELIASRMCVAGEEIRTNNVRAFLYEVDVDFLFLDELSALNRPSKTDGYMKNIGPITEADKSLSPTLGLRSAELGLDWRVSAKFKVLMVLRPDAAGGGHYQEVDTRAGRVVEESPSIHFLDQYRLIYQPSASSLRIGVENEVLESYRVVPETLDFGLRVRGPEKAMAAGFDIPKLVEFNQGRDGAGIGVSTAALSGRNERHDSRHQEAGGSGESPAKKDPYWGAAAALTWTLEGETRIGIGMATLEERTDGVKVRNQWYQAGVRKAADISSGGRWLLAMEARQLRQSFALEGTEISSVSLSSVGITTSYERRSGEGPMLGVWVGSGELHPPGVLSESKPSKGSLLNFGWQWRMEDALQISMLVSREWRRDGGVGTGDTGGFIDGDSSRSVMSRMAVGVRYFTGGQF